MTNTIEHGFVILRKSDGKFVSATHSIHECHTHDLQGADFCPSTDPNWLTDGNDEEFVPATRDAAGHVTLEEGK